MKNVLRVGAEASGKEGYEDHKIPETSCSHTGLWADLEEHRWSSMRGALFGCGRGMGMRRG